VDLVHLHDVPLPRLVVIAGQRLSQRWNRLLAERYGLTGAGMSVLLLLHHHGELSHSDLANKCYVRPATLTGIIDTLEKAGLVERRRHAEDRRAVRLALTLEGAVQAVSLGGIIRNPRPLTSVDADPAKAAVIREFLFELIAKMADEDASPEYSKLSNGEDGR
jgi:MarR family transcriptional regulator, organic hydroperoxide resistance regulator